MLQSVIEITDALGLGVEDLDALVDELTDEESQIPFVNLPYSKRMKIVEDALTQVLPHMSPSPRVSPQPEDSPGCQVPTARRVATRSAPKRKIEEVGEVVSE